MVPALFMMRFVYLCWTECPEIALLYSLGNGNGDSERTGRKPLNSDHTKSGLPIQIPCKVYFWPVNWWASSEMRSPREAAAIGICTNSLQPQWLKGTWTPLLWNIKWRVTSLIAAAWKYFQLDLLNINDKKQLARRPLLQKYVSLSKQCKAIWEKEGSLGFLEKRPCEPLFFLICMEAAYIIKS